MGVSQNLGSLSWGPCTKDFNILGVTFFLGIYHVPVGFGVSDQGLG